MRKRHIVVLSEAERARLHTMIGRGVAPASALTHARILLKATRARPVLHGPMPPSGRRWRSTRPPWPGSAGAMSRPGWTPRYIANRPRAPTAAGWTGSRRPTWSRWRAARRRKGASVGHCGCWPSGWWSCRWWRRSRMRRCGRPCSKPAQAVADPVLVHPARARRRVLLADGGRAGRLHPPYDPRRPQVCLDQTSRQLLAEVTLPQPVAPGRCARQDYEYLRQGWATSSWCVSRWAAGGR
jgi:hypothetical protein